MKQYNKYVRAYVMAVAVVLAITLSACKVQTKVITEYRDRIERDTIQKVDSIYQDRFREIFTAGDTVYVHDSVFLYKYKFQDRDRYVYVHDSIPYPVEVPTPYEEHGFLWKSGLVAWIIMAVIIIGFLIYVVLRIYRKV